MSDDPFEQGYRGDAPTYNVSLNEQYAYQDGLAARREEQQRAAEREQQSRAEQDRIRTANDRANYPVSYGTPYVAPRGGGTRPEQEEEDLVGFFVGLPLTAGVIAAGVAFFLGLPALYWGAVVGGGLFALLVALVVVTGGAMALVWGVRQVLSLWAWILGIAILGAALGFGAATMANLSSVLVQQRAIESSLVGGAAGLALGLVNRAVRALRR